MNSRLAADTTTHLSRDFLARQGRLVEEIAPNVPFPASNKAACITGGSRLMDAGIAMTPIPAIDTHIQP